MEAKKIHYRFIYQLIRNGTVFGLRCIYSYVVTTVQLDHAIHDDAASMFHSGKFPLSSEILGKKMLSGRISSGLPTTSGGCGRISGILCLMRGWEGSAAAGSPHLS